MAPLDHRYELPALAVSVTLPEQKVVGPLAVMSGTDPGENVCAVRTLLFSPSTTVSTPLTVSDCIVGACPPMSAIGFTGVHEFVAGSYAATVAIDVFVPSGLPPMT